MYSIYLVRKAIIPKLLEDMKLSLKAKRVRDILSDFEKYLREQRVIVHYLNRSTVHATVIGSDAYTVLIKFNTGYFYCTCPHYKYRRALCKHTLILLELYVYLTKMYEVVSKFLKENESKIV